jgi:anti-sigma regulatory factor (Ser/Thr protein kinase)
MEHAFTFPSRRHELAPALDRIEALLLELAVEREIAAELRLVVEEGLVNIVTHAYGSNEEGEVAVALAVQVTDVRLVLRDRGRPFNPLEQPGPDLDLPVDERPIGGLGIHLIKTLTDEQTYRREGEENVLVLIKRRRLLS